jgi:hypothetical protein
VNLRRGPTWTTDGQQGQQGTVGCSQSQVRKRVFEYVVGRLWAQT